ncbi:acetyltransferase, ribosomal protein N-acetylase [Bernardetia litoralis DSM 6794]|uniref:Acetyltransferase, ribosomal protein N-acetylase n=1 Tax=Bernardetia litoralis (strain ATCC 23117 / DSM 6794 / NBRC 15988 / NCIMB 1366 / Fx l1 / Sio-4) TaxID=880071 RepID=I4ANJ4_BERLS|nr:GNAT family N-acetyltransferase [Bernardetia litoralis]AFM05529.1 acetyltransferase, ribosomal protein N-acetylase [Bernardetia litoralis DSM 6794]
MITTDRLILKPLNYNQLIKHINCNNSLEKELNLNTNSRTLSPELREFFEQKLLLNLANSNKNYLYSTLWIAISKVTNQIIGDLSIAGQPNQEGEIEIGYETYKEFQNQGFMTEMIEAIIKWAKTESKIKSIIALTKETNNASCKVLQKNNFSQVGQTESVLNWKLDID